MSVVALPASLLISAFKLRLSVNQRIQASNFGGSEQTIDMLNDRWLATIETPGRAYDIAAVAEAYITSMRAQTNTTALYHYVRPAPRGTMRGSLALAAGAAQGAASLSVTGGSGQAYKTLCTGDMLGLGGMLLMVQADCTANASGVITVLLANRLRIAQSSGSVTWDRPTASFRMLSSDSVGYSGMTSDTTTIEFGEVV